MSPMEARIVHVGIDRPAGAVYAFASRIESMPLWASGLADGLQQAADDWVAKGPLGDVRIQFTPPNAFGVLDHTVTMPSGETVLNALRVVPNGQGSEVMFLLTRRAGMSDAQYAADAAWVLKDLMALKAILETE